MLDLRRYFKRAAIFSVVTNVLALAPAIYMFEVYGRVVTSRNSETLLMLTLLILGVYLLLEALEWVRTSILHNAGLRLDAALAERIFNGIFEASLRKPGAGATQALGDLRTVRDFLSSPAMLSVLDAPFALLFLLMVFLIHPLLGMFSLVGAVIQVVVSLLNERRSRPALKTATRSMIAAQGYANSTLRNAQVIEAMGMARNIESRWLARQQEFLVNQANASDSAGGSAAAAKFLQLFQTSMILGLGAWLNLKGQMGAANAGLIVVASILSGKVLAPLLQLMAQWKVVITATDAYQRLDEFLQANPARKYGMPLPPPKGHLKVQISRAGPPGSPMPTLHDLNFVLPAGQVLAVVGPSASGKTTLARMLVGIWPVAAGKIRLDATDVYARNKEELGPYVGYLPQDIELLEGTLAENIARFGELDMAKVEEAARRVGLHETIMALPNGYETPIGEDGLFLSGGQRQRVGLARAIYDLPRLIVLDEPNSNLDEPGEMAMVRTLQKLKATGATLVIITHRPMVLSIADRILLLQNGTMKEYGPREKVLGKIYPKTQQAAKPAPDAAAAALPSPSGSAA
jgi:ATP-binding cassette subfamily C exporter for protease/lipase